MKITENYHLQVTSYFKKSKRSEQHKTGKSFIFKKIRYIDFNINLNIHSL